MFWPIYDEFAPLEGDFEDPGYDSRDLSDHHYGAQGVDDLEASSSQQSNLAERETDEADDCDQPPALDWKPRPRAITPAELAQALPNYYSTSSDEEDGASSPSPDSSPARLGIVSSTPASTPSGSATPSQSLVVTPSEPEEYFDPDYFIHNRPDPIFEPDPSSGLDEPLPKIRIPPLAARNLLPNIPSSSAQTASTGKNLKRRRDPDGESETENRPPLRRSKRLRR